MFGYDLGIDLGTSSIVISVVGKGVVLSEPAYVAYDVNKSEMLYAGKRAYYLEGREPVGVSVIQPIKSGNVSNYDLACQMVEYFMNKVLKKNIFKPRIVASVSSDSTDVERRTLISVLISAGARSVCLVEQPLCAAFGAGIDPLNPTGVFVIDVGAGSTDMAVISQGAMSQNETVKIGGDDFDEAIVKYLEFVGDNYELPFLIDSTSGDARVAGARYADEVGLTQRAIYNSINMSAEKSELEALKETDIDSSIILGFNPMNSTVQGKIAMWEDGDDGSYEKGLLEVAADCGIDKFMMDTAVTPLGQGAGIAAKTTFAEKAKRKIKVLKAIIFFNFFIFFPSFYNLF